MVKNVRFYANRYDAKAVNSSKSNSKKVHKFIMDGSINYLIKEAIRKLLLLRASANLTHTERELLDEVIDTDLVELQMAAKSLPDK